MARPLPLRSGKLSQTLRLSGSACAPAGRVDPKRLYEVLRENEHGSCIAWDCIHWFLGDERFVSMTDERSNAGMAYREFPGVRAPAAPHCSYHTAASQNGRGLARFYRFRRLWPEARARDPHRSAACRGASSRWSRHILRRSVPVDQPPQLARWPMQNAVVACSSGRIEMF